MSQGAVLWISALVRSTAGVGLSPPSHRETNTPSASHSIYAPVHGPLSVSPTPFVEEQEKARRMPKKLHRLVLRKKKRLKGVVEYL